MAGTRVDLVSIELNVREIRPPRMDDSGKTKYPVLFHVYVSSPFFPSIP